MTATLHTIKLTLVTCSGCYATWGMDPLWEDRKRRDHSWWNCPYCRASLHYPEQSDIERAEAATKRAHELLEQQKSCTKQAWEIADQRAKDRDAAERRASARAGVATRLKNRVRRGLCPCCSKSFADIKAHMESSHPGYGEAD